MVKKKREIPPIQAPEYEIDKIKANRYRDFMDADGGWLTITNERLLFNPHLLNFNHSVEEILLEEIQSLGHFSPWGIIPNGMLVICHDGTAYKFVVNQRDRVIDLIQKHLPQP